MAREEWPEREGGGTTPRRDRRTVPARRGGHAWKVIGVLTSMVVEKLECFATTTRQPW